MFLNRKRWVLIILTVAALVSSPLNIWASGASIIDTTLAHLSVLGAGCPEDPVATFGVAGAVFKAKPSTDTFSVNELVGAEGTCNEEVLASGKGNVSVAAALTSGMGSMIRTRPASAEVYVADVLKNIIPVESAYAQGLGFSALDPILPIWKVFRNIAYFLIVIMFMVVGFAIMFRAKLNPQTVVSIESALPQIVITLLLITFSYAIVGLLIDVMYLAIYLFIGMAGQFIFQDQIQTSFIIDHSQTLEQIAFRNNIFQNGFLFVISGGATTITNSVANIVSNIFSTQGIPLIDQISRGFIHGTTALLFYPILIAIILVQLFRVFFALLGAYVQIILNVIFSPIILLTNALPGSQSFTNWIKNIVANLAVFPVVIILLLISMALTSTSVRGNIGYGGDRNGFAPPQLGFSVGEEAGSFQGIIALGMLLAMPKALEFTKQAFGVGGGGGGGGGNNIFAPIIAPIRGVAGLPMGVARTGLSVGVGSFTQAVSGIYQSNLGNNGMGPLAAAKATVNQIRGKNPTTNQQQNQPPIPAPTPGQTPGGNFATPTNNPAPAAQQTPIPPAQPNNQPGGAFAGGRNRKGTHTSSNK